MNPRILVIDDDRSVRDAFELALDGRGYDVITAEDGPAGLDAAREQRPDLVFLDLKMPGMSGVEVLAILLDEMPGLRVYIVTAFYQEYMDQLHEARRKGLKFQLAAKPLAPEQIVAIASAFAHAPEESSHASE